MKNSKKWYFLGILLTVVVLSNLVLWWYTFAKPLPYEEIKATYMGYFPDWVDSARYLTGFFVLVNILSLYFLGKAIDYLSENYRRVGVPVMVLSGLLLALQLWSLM